MKTNTELMTNLQAVLRDLYPLAKAGDENAHVKLAWGNALYEYLDRGHCLTDLDWFKGTTYYTGADAGAETLPKAA